MRTSPVVALTVLSLSLACGGGDAEPPPVEPVPPPAEPVAEVPTEPEAPKTATAFMVIAHSSKDKAKVQRLMAEYNDQGHPSHEAFPLFMSSTGIEGLKPDYWLVVVATPDTYGTALEIEQGLEARGMKNAYVREVKLEEALIQRDLDADQVIIPPAHVAAWIAEGETCRWALLDVSDGGKELRTLATLPMKCGFYYKLSRGADDRFLIQMENEGLYEARTKTGATRTLTKPGKMPVDGIGYAKDGKTIAAWTQGGELKTSGEGDEETGWFQLGDRRIDIEDYYPDTMGYDLCIAWKLEGEAWKEVTTGITEATEGTRSPFCVGLKGDPVDSEIFWPTHSGGHGVFGSKELPRQDWSDQMKSQEASLASLHDGDTHFALVTEWLEGESYAQPVFLEIISEGENEWVPLLGLTGRGGFNWRIQGRQMLACGHRDAAIYDLGTGKRTWFVKSDLCPAWWHELGKFPEHP